MSCIQNFSEGQLTLLKSHLSEEELSRILNNKYHPTEFLTNDNQNRNLNFGLLPNDITFGIEFEFINQINKVALINQGLELLTLFSSIPSTYSQEKDSIYFSQMRHTPINVKNLCISEVATPPLNDTSHSMYYLKSLYDIFSRVVTNVPNIPRRNIHIHFDQKVLGNKLEFLKPFLMVVRAYENIIYRLSCSEVGIPPKKGLSDRISETLKCKNISQMLKTYNGDGQMNLITYDISRHYGINLFNLRCHLLSGNKKPCIMYTNTGETGFCENLLRNVRLELNPQKGIKNESMLHKIPSTIEFRLSPFTCDIGFLQHYLLLYNTILGMARDLNINKELESKVIARNRAIDENGPNIFNIPFDTEGINDIITWLSQYNPEFSKMLLSDYASSKPLLQLVQEDPNISNAHHPDER